jgi:hypothetical protein
MQLVIWDDVKQKPVITLEFRTSVLRVRLSKSRIVVALLNSVHVFAFSTPPEKLSVFETTDNPLGLRSCWHFQVGRRDRSSWLNWKRAT